VAVDVDDLDDVAADCGISAMPTFQLYSNGGGLVKLNPVRPIIA
jgi:hypothetical protein